MSFYQHYKWLLPSLLFSLALLAVRVTVLGQFDFLFLPWNLFLALLPLYFGMRARDAEGTGRFLVWGGLWLLFFPNAAYITTDIFHLGEDRGAPLWFDLVLLSSAAINGLLYGLLSLHSIEEKLRRLWPQRIVAMILFGLMLLCGYGICLGRYLRWNSWDIVTNPLRLARDMMHHFIHPIRNADVWSLSLVFGLWILVLYNFVRRGTKQLL